MIVMYFWEDGCPACEYAESILGQLEARVTVRRVQVATLGGDRGFYLYGTDVRVPVLEKRGVPAISIDDVEHPLVLVGASCVRAALAYLKVVEAA